jgi:hypothetical protein
MKTKMTQVSTTYINPITVHVQVDIRARSGNKKKSILNIKPEDGDLLLT